MISQFIVGSISRYLDKYIVNRFLPITKFVIDNILVKFNLLLIMYGCNMDTIEALILYMVYYTKGMVLIFARMIEKIHLKC